MCLGAVSVTFLALMIFVACPMWIVFFVGAGFLTVGQQSVRGTARDTLGNGIGSIGLSVLLSGCGGILFLDLNVLKRVAVGPVIMLGTSSSMSAALFTAGILALAGRAQYRAWRESDQLARGPGEEARDSISRAETCDPEGRKNDDRIVSLPRFGVKKSVDPP
jgi:hypothetical protein